MDKVYRKLHESFASDPTKHYQDKYVRYREGPASGVLGTGGRSGTIRVSADRCVYGKHGGIVEQWSGHYFRRVELCGRRVAYGEKWPTENVNGKSGERR